MNLPHDLQIGDILLYSTPDLPDEVIEVKTGDDVAHVEVYAGNGQSWASRNGIGVGAYPFRAAGLKYVRRPAGVFDLSAAVRWFATVNGAPYGWEDILDAVDIVVKLPGMDCSDFAASLLEKSGCPQFDPAYDKHKITPRDFKLSPASVNLPLA